MITLVTIFSAIFLFLKDRSEARVCSVRCSFYFWVLHVNSISTVSYKLITSFILCKTGMQETFPESLYFTAHSCLSKYQSSEWYLNVGMFL